jgi:hypothetical protein
VAQEFGRHLDQVYSAGRSGAVQLDGQNIFIYRECTAEQLIVDFAVGANAPFAAVGAVEPRYTPGGAAAMAIHWGDYAVWGVPLGALHLACAAIFGSLADRRSPPAAS